MDHVLANPLAAFATLLAGTVVYFLWNRKKAASDLAAAPSLVAVNRNVDSVKEKASKYTKLHEFGGGTKQERVDNAQDMTNYYYDLVTDFYEFGWGQSFHFAPRFKGESFDDSLTRHEWYIGSRLQVAPGEHILDVGCGVGGPMRNIARFTKARITGINNNAYQLKRVAAKNIVEKLADTCSGVKGDFMNMPFEDATFDGIYAIEATVHAPDRTGCYREIFRTLKPGKLFCAYEWVVTDKYDPKNKYHVQLKEGIEIGNSLPDIARAADVLQSLRDAGFEVLEHSDLAANSEVPWYAPLGPSCTLSGFKSTPIGIKLTNIAVRAMEAVKLAPAGSSQMHQNLSTGALTLHNAGAEDIFTPCYFFVARKPAVGGAVKPASRR